MTPKELFLTNSEKASQLRAITKASWFHQCLVSVRAELMNSVGLSSDQLKGALMYETTLLELANETPDTADLRSGLVHEIDNPRPQPVVKKTADTKTK